MSETANQDMSGVAETSLITLYLRAMESQRPDALIKDERAVELVARLGEGQTVYIPGWQNWSIVAAARSGLYALLLDVLKAFLSWSRRTVAEKSRLARQ
jgi:O-methyltransferase involved in polyketide biosynthesis